MSDKEKGVIQILCEEVGAVFTDKMEGTAVLVSFVAVLVDEIDCMIGIEKQIYHLTGKDVPDDTVIALDSVKSLLLIKDREKLIKACENAHRVTYVPDDGPCNHYIDMLSSCVSAIRFGLEMPCHSRHAAEAANHVWKHQYGVTQFDKHSNSWERQWARDKFYEALGNS